MSPITDFVFGSGTESYFSCSTLLHGKMLIIGGSDRQRQISELVDCHGLAPVGTLSFDFYSGACGTYNFNHVDTVLLCFQQSGGKHCHTISSATEWEIVQIGFSNDAHKGTSLGSYNDRPVAIAGETSKKVESFSNDRWEPLSEGSMMPIHDTLCGLRDFSTLTYGDRLWVFGGRYCEVDVHKDVRCYTVSTSSDVYWFGWRETGSYGWKLESLSLNRARRGHRSILINHEVIHIGGADKTQFNM